CCKWGQGSYELAFGDTIVAQRGVFGGSDTNTTFATPSASASPNCYDVHSSWTRTTSWNVTTEGLAVASSMSYGENTKGYEPQFCLPKGDCVFSIYDAFGDVVCCKWGQGRYELSMLGRGDPIIIKEGGEFGPSQSVTFSIPVQK
ncbi:LOW QUALITY PROTEIN: hypothetical protein ACHAWF_000316, partial [Thalassiosira exigua]